MNIAVDIIYAALHITCGKCGIFGEYTVIIQYGIIYVCIYILMSFLCAQHYAVHLVIAKRNWLCNLPLTMGNKKSAGLLDAGFE